MGPRVRGYDIDEKNIIKDKGEKAMLEKMKEIIAEQLSVDMQTALMRILPSRMIWARIPWICLIW